MKYLFFDIECSNCFNGIGKICEYGYVLTDEKFNILKADDIPMSPGRGRDSRFHLKGRKHEKDLELAYEYDFYLSQPEFPHFYERIKELMEDPDTVCFAYSMDNDIAHLSNSARRYRLPEINYTCYDIQKLAIEYLETDKQVSLAKACTKIVGPSAMVTLQEHLSRDDAKMEMLIFDALCALTKKDSLSILNESEFAKANSIEYMQKVREKAKRTNNKKKTHDYYRFICTPVDELDNPEYIGKRYNISGELKVHEKEMHEVIDKIKELGGVFSNALSKTDIFVMYDAKNKEDVLRRISDTYKGKCVTFQEFMKGGN